MPETFVDNPWKIHVFVQQITLGSVREPTKYNVMYARILLKNVRKRIRAEFK